MFKYETTGVTRLVNPALQGGRSFTQILEDLREIISAMHGIPPPELTEMQPEGIYDPKTMTWEGWGGRHSQKCNARRQTEQGPQRSSAPDLY